MVNTEEGLHVQVHIWSEKRTGVGDRVVRHLFQSVTVCSLTSIRPIIFHKLTGQTELTSLFLSS